MNRAKCKKCNDILNLDEKSKDLVICKCGNLQVECNNKKITCCYSDSLEMVDENGCPISSFTDTPEPTKKDLLTELDMMIKNFSDLPDHAMLTPITHYDFASALLLLSAILRLDNRS